MKNTLRILIGVIVGVSIFHLVKGKPSESPKLTEISTSLSSEDKFKQDMLEVIMEFANASTSVDSLYIPDWLK